MSGERRYRVSDRALLTELGDGTGVLLDLDSKFYFTLNDTAIFVWKLLSARTTLSREQLAMELTGSFQVDAEKAQVDVDAVLDLLTRERLVLVSADAL